MVQQVCCFVAVGLADVLSVRVVAGFLLSARLFSVLRCCFFMFSVFSICSEEAGSTVMPLLFCC